MKPLHCFTTAMLDETGRNANLDRLVASLRDARGEGGPISLYLLLQNAKGEVGHDLSDPFIALDAAPEKMSLSKARNRLLAQHLAAVDDEDIVAFPDDDAWYPPGFVAHLRALFEERPTLDFYFCHYASEPDAAQSSRSVEPDVGQVLRFASSNTIFARGGAVRAVGGFDEDLGVGAPLGGGEDTDFALRLRAASREVLGAQQCLVGHRDRQNEHRSRYYRGSLAAISRNTNREASLYFQLARKIGVGGFYVLKGEHSLKTWVATTAEALKAPRAKAPDAE
ncbi:MAG: glycosyltransferase family A protein [Pseudomonadota bacterium]